MSMISELVEELIDNADLHTKELHELMYRAADTIEMLSEKAREPKKGEWIFQECNDESYGRAYECSICGVAVVGNHHNFCPNCGADMRGEDDE